MATNTSPSVRATVVSAEEQAARPPEAIRCELERLAAALDDAQRCLTELRVVARLLVTCPTTRLVTRVEGLEVVRRECHVADFACSVLSVLLIDIDHFKQFNDLLGDHLVGDRVLRAVADIIIKNVAPRRRDCVIRWSGDELLVLLPDAPSDAAHVVAERIRLAVHDIEIANREVSVSIGVSTREPGHDFNIVLARADAALYSAKHLGRDRVVGHADGNNSTSKFVNRHVHCDRIAD